MNSSVESGWLQSVVDKPCMLNPPILLAIHHFREKQEETKMKQCISKQNLSYFDITGTLFS